MADRLVLCYHAVSERWEAPLSVTPEALEHQLERLVRRGYEGATFADTVSGGSGRRTVAVTFDDAFASVLALAAPILERLGLPATVFVPTDFPDGRRSLAWPGIDEWLDGPYAAELEPLGWGQLEGLARAGWEIGSHTRSHPRLTTLGDDALADELATSRRVVEERLGGPCVSIAYPYGDVDGRVAAAARDAGYRAGAALSRSLRLAGPLQFPRVGIYHADDARRFALKASPFTRALRARLLG